MKIFLKYLYRGFCVVVFFSLLFFANSFLEKLLIDHGQTDDGVTLLYEMPKNSVDVAVVGSSHTYCGFNPSLFFEQTGYTAALMSSSRQTPRVTYHYVQDLLTIQKPKVIFIDAASIMENYYAALDTDGSPVDVEHRAISLMAPSLNKIAAIKDVLWEDKSYVDYFIAPLNHSAWSSLKKENYAFSFGKSYELTRGVPISKLMLHKMVPDEFVYNRSSNPSSYDKNLVESNIQYFEKILQLANDDTEIILCMFPILKYNDQEFLLAVIEQYYNEKNIKFLNICDELNLDISNFMDVGHANYFGGEIITKYLAEYVASNYSIENKIEDERYAQYLVAAEYYRAEKMRMQQELNVENF